MTNQEWLGTLSPEEWWNVVYDYVLHDYGIQYNHSQLAIIDWLKQEHKPIEVWDRASGQMKIKWK